MWPSAAAPKCPVADHHLPAPATKCGHFESPRTKQRRSSFRDNSRDAVGAEELGVATLPTALWRRVCPSCTNPVDLGWLDRPPQTKIQLYAAAPPSVIRIKARPKRSKRHIDPPTSIRLVAGVGLRRGFDSLAGLLGVGQSATGIDVIKAQQNRLTFRGALTALFTDIDVLLTPTQPATTSRLNASTRSRPAREAQP
ncbi:Uncharacterised protein [Mycobacteroides abscessus]|nr:Uncharacterised protein [Mycobacteroides abscessus]